MTPCGGWNQRDAGGALRSGDERATPDESARGLDIGRGDAIFEPRFEAFARRVVRRLRTGSRAQRPAEVGGGERAEQFARKHAFHVREHAIQMELSFRGYVNEPDGKSTPETWPPEYDAARAAPMRAALESVIAACLDFARQGVRG